MLIVHERFKTAIVTDGDGFRRVCTGEFLNSSDVTADDSQAYTPVQGELLIHSRRDVWNAVRWNMVTTCSLAIAGFVGLCVSSAVAYMDAALRANPVQFSGKYVLVAFFTLLFVGMFHQCVHPVVHDNADHWVDLWNGSSNLCGGIVIHRKARWF